jgi:hypothetical protein
MPILAGAHKSAFFGVYATGTFSYRYVLQYATGHIQIHTKRTNQLQVLFLEFSCYFILKKVAIVPMHNDET